MQNYEQKKDRDEIVIEEWKKSCLFALWYLIVVDNPSTHKAWYFAVPVWQFLMMLVPLTPLSQLHNIVSMSHDRSAKFYSFVGACFVVIYIISYVKLKLSWFHCVGRLRVTLRCIENSPTASRRIIKLSIRNFLFETTSHLTIMWKSAVGSKCVHLQLSQNKISMELASPFVYLFFLPHRFRWQLSTPKVFCFSFVH